ncbi:hypothetical protein JCM5296_007334 [Sporobolomyces johnsonii]
MLVKALVAGLAVASPALAFFRLPCDNILIQERADPIISPGEVAGHVHTVVGGSNFGLNATYADLRSSECTSCHAKADLSAYWTPQLYIHWANGTYSSVPQTGSGLIYYLFRDNPSDTTNVTAFPEGLKMTAGNPFRRTYNESNLEEQAIGWNCLGSAPPTRVPRLPQVNCPDGLRGEIRFPSCWDGTNLYKSDQSHMAYSDGETGPCPSTHPVRIVTLFYEIMYSIDPLKDDWAEAMDPNSPFVLAMGDATGYGYHGDFLNGWDVPTLQKAVEVCTADSGVIEDCPVLELYNRTESGNCFKTPDVNEIVMGNVESLPGCNPITETEAQALAATCPNLEEPSVFSHPVVYNGTYPPPVAKEVLKGTPTTVLSYQGYKYIGCFSDSADRTFPTQLTIAEQTVSACLNAAKEGGYQYAGIEYFGQCYVSNTAPPVSKKISYGYCDTPCTDRSSNICGGPLALTMYRLTRTTSSRAKRHELLGLGHT